MAHLILYLRCCFLNQDNLHIMLKIKTTYHSLSELGAEVVIFQHSFHCSQSSSDTILVKLSLSLHQQEGLPSHTL